jgi:hypothetical protein
MGEDKRALQKMTIEAITFFIKCFYNILISKMYLRQAQHQKSLWDNLNL